MLRWNNSISFMPRQCENITNGVSWFLHSDLMNQWKYLRYCWEDFRSPLLMRDKHSVFNLRNNFLRRLSGWITTTLDKIILIPYVFWTCSAQIYLDLIAPYVDQLKLKSIQTSPVFYTSSGSWAVSGVICTELSFSWSRRFSSWTTVPFVYATISFRATVFYTENRNLSFFVDLIPPIASQK